MKKKYIYFFTGVAFSSLISVALIGLYHFYVSSDRYFNDQKQRAIAVAEQEILFSERLSQTFRSAIPTDFVQAATMSRKAVVFVKSDGNGNHNPNNESDNNLSSGSGVIISQDGYIVTNQHVIANAKNIEIRLNDKRQFSAKLIGADPSTDLALLKIEIQNADFLVFGNSDSLQIGEWIMAVGNPFKLQSTVTAGIVSAKGRNINLLENHGIESFIQTDAAVNPGNSGGALINTKGDLLGICTAILSNSGRYEGFSFAIPSNLARKVISDLKEFGAVQRGWLSVDMEDVDNQAAINFNLPAVEGVFISSVAADGAAANAGLRRSDVVISINGVKTENTSIFMEQLANFHPGDKVELGFYRDGKKIFTKAVLRNQLNTTDMIAVRDDQILTEIGLELRNLDSYEKAVLTPSGVMVVSVKSESLVGNTKMEPAYIITKLNNKEVSSVDGIIHFLDSNRGKTIIFEGFYKKYPGEYPYTFVMPSK